MESITRINIEVVAVLNLGGYMQMFIITSYIVIGRNFDGASVYVTILIVIIRYFYLNIISRNSFSFRIEFIFFSFYFYFYTHDCCI